MSKVDIEASLKVIETARIRPFAIENAAYIRAARDPITGWEPTLLELREALAELKRRDETVKPAMRRSGETICGDCEYRVYMDYKRCPNCGRPLDWSDK